VGITVRGTTLFPRTSAARLSIRHWRSTHQDRLPG